jgi:drug/metabolite transporter (DMT)-like permease
LSPPRTNSRAIIALVIAMAAFSANDTLVKLVATTYPIGEVIFVRGAMASVLVGSLVLALGHVRAIPKLANRLIAGRSALDAAANILFTTALVHMPLADLSAIAMVAPLIITALAVVLYGEPVRWRRWTAIAIGFIGVLFVVKPTPASFDAWALLGLGCAFVSATRDLITRNLHPSVPSLIVSLATALAVMAGGMLMGLRETWQGMDRGALGLLAVAAVLLAIGNFLVVFAFRQGEVSAIAPFRYTVLLWAGIGGYLAFGELPDRWALAGAALIMSSGIYALHREEVRKRELTSRVLPPR